jgi:hypothetical protein
VGLIGGLCNYAPRRMDIAAFCTESRVLVVAGKGGVGKTTTSAALALLAARHGLSVLLVELEGKPALAAAFGQQGPLDYEDATLFDDGPGSVRGRWITPDDALLEYLGDHGFQRVSQAARVVRGHRRGLDGHPRDPRRPGAGQGQAARARADAPTWSWSTRRPPATR